MNRKLFLIIFILSSLILSGFIYLYKSNADKNIKENLDKLNNGSTEDIVRLYWNAAFIGDAATINQLAALPPKDMFGDCKEYKTVEVTNSVESEMPSKILAIVKNSSAIKMESPFSESSTTPTSDFIYYSRISLKRTQLKEKRIYGDEALLNIIIADSRGDFTKPLIENLFFLKKGEQGWKIVGAVDSTIEKLGKIYYATQRPICRE